MVNHLLGPRTHAQKLAFHGQPPPGARREILRSLHLATRAGEVVGHEKQVFAVAREQPGGHEERVKTQGG